MTANQSSPFEMSDFRVHLEDGPHARALKITSDFWDQVEGDAELSNGRILSAFFAREPEDLHPSMWEMHPEGDELLYLCSGTIDLVLEDSPRQRTFQLRAGSAYIVPPGVWHRLLLREPGILLAVTRGKGTRLREV
jgi:mannose-6-phosphate isomerase-like protein (cupin superfamily)